MNTSVTSISIPNSCRDGLIGVRGVCSDTYAYYLDTLGISLSKAAKLSDSAKLTGKELVDEAVEQAWGYVFGDLKVQGFQVQGVRHSYKQEFGTELKDAGTYTIELERSCEFEQFYLNKIKLKVSGDLDCVLTVTYNETDWEVFNDSLSDETLTLTVDSPFPYEDLTITLEATGTGQLYATGEDSPILYDMLRECNENLFYCKYQKWLIDAVMFKAAALILNNSIFNDRYNDLIAYSKADIAIRIAQLDSQYNLLNAENRINKTGLYQQEIEKINRKLKTIVDSGCHCGCCFECSELISTKITIP